MLKLMSQMMTHMPKVKIQPDDLVLVKLTALEAHLIKIIRSTPFGKIIVETVHGAPYKAVSQNSILLKADQVDDLIVQRE